MYSFGKCLKTGFKTTRKTLKTSKFNFIKFMFIKFISILLRVCIITYPLGRLIESRTGNIMINENDINIYKPFKSKNFSQAIFYFLFELFMLLAGALVFGLFGFIIACITKLLSFNTNVFESFTNVLIIPVVIGYLLFAIIFIIYYRSGWYLFDKEENIECSKLIYNSGECMKLGGKFTMFILEFVYLLLQVLLFGILFGIFIILNYILDLGLIAGIYGIVAIVVYIFIALRISMARMNSLAFFYKDVTLREVKEVEPVKEVIKSDEKLVLKSSSKEDVLSNLFD